MLTASLFAITVSCDDADKPEHDETSKNMQVLIKRAPTYKGEEL